MNNQFVLVVGRYRNRPILLKSNKLLQRTLWNSLRLCGAVSNGFQDEYNCENGAVETARGRVDLIPKHTMTIYAHELPEDAEQVRTAMGKIG